MNVFETTQRGWKLLHSAIYVIRKHPKLFLFPFIISGFTIIIAAFFMAPIIVLAIHHPIYPKGVFVTGRGLAAPNLPGWAFTYSIFIYPLSMFCATFCNVAFYSQILAALNGDPVSIRRGFKIAAGRIKSIFVWSLFAGIVGSVIRAIESRLGFVGRIIMGIIGLTWSVSCIFAIPVIIRERPTANPIGILSRSAGVIKRTWGESLFGYLGVGALNLIVLVCGVIALVASIVVIVMAHKLFYFWILLPLPFLILLGMAIYHCIANLAGQAYLCALYIYASEGVIPEPYNQELLDQAWQVKRG